jgi:DNA-directed RNA polymerase subunit H (RpoH/RPB5)
MSTFKIFQLEKNNDDIKRTILTNVVKMLTERNLFKPENLEENIKKISSMQSDDYTFIIDKENYDSENNKKIAIKIFHQKITAISKQSNISDFLNKYKDMHKIVIVKSITTKASQFVVNNYPKTELFLENELMINLIDNVFVPRYENLDYESDDYKNFFSDFQCKKRNMPRLYQNDPLARYYNLKRNDIVRIIRPSETSGESPFYRLVI